MLLSVAGTAELDRSCSVPGHRGRLVSARVLERFACFRKQGHTRALNQQHTSTVTPKQSLLRAFHHPSPTQKRTGSVRVVGRVCRVGYTLPLLAISTVQFKYKL